MSKISSTVIFALAASINPGLLSCDLSSKYFVICMDLSSAYSAASQANTEKSLTSSKSRFFDFVSLSLMVR